jgi:hypothetical protein
MYPHSSVSAEAIPKECVQLFVAGVQLWIDTLA